MPFVRKYGWALQLFWKPIRDVLQRWRLSLASLVFFTIFLTNNFGLSTSLNIGIGVAEAAGPGSFRETGDTLAHPNAVSGAGSSHKQTGPGLTKPNKYIAPSSSSTQQQARGSSKPRRPQDNISYYSRTSLTIEEYQELFNATSRQCLVLDSDIAEEICSKPVQSRTRKMRQLKLKFCNFIYVFHAIDEQKCKIEGTESECRKCFEEVQKSDKLAYAMYCPFQDLLSKYNCENKFSTHWTCSDCKEAYRNWACAMTVPYYKNSLQIQPCQKYCELVENRCPYFQPHRSSQYAGEPSFLCRGLDQKYMLHSEEGHSSHSTAEGGSSLVSVTGTDEACHHPCPRGNVTEVCVAENVSRLLQSTATATPPQTNVLLTPGHTRGGAADKTQTYTALTPGANSSGGPYQSTSSGALSSVFQCSTQPKTLSFLQNNHLLIVAQLAFLLWHIWTSSIQSLYRVIGLT